MNSLMPATTSATEVQRNYKKVAQRAKKLKEPIVILSNNRPDGVYIDYETFSTKFDKNSSFDRFTGVWTKKEADEFDKIIENAFEKIDYEEWK